MKFELERAIEILRQTPYVMARLLEDLSPDWTASEGDENDWSQYDVIGHLIHGEQTDWIPRAEIILAQGADLSFQPYDRLAQFRSSKSKSLSDLLIEFAHLRNANIERLQSFQLNPGHLALKGIHPEFGEVTLEELLATWVVHDLSHIRQVVTYMAKKYSTEVGPWKAYLSILNE